MVRIVQPRIITIDGPASSGKSSLARGIARLNSMPWVSTGILYRLVGWICHHRGMLSGPEPSKLAELVQGLAGGLGLDTQLGLTLAPSPWLDGKDPREVIKKLAGEEVGLWASQVAALPVLRQELLPLQRSLAGLAPPEGVVFDGRDMGTLVFADCALIKFFLTAPLEVRALRRWRDINGDQSPKGIEWSDFIQRMHQRDHGDTSRTTAPLYPAGDAIIVDTSLGTQEDVLRQMNEHYQKALAESVRSSKPPTTR